MYGSHFFAYTHAYFFFSLISLYLTMNIQQNYTNIFVEYIVS